MVAFALGLNVCRMGQRQIFRWPFGPLQAIVPPEGPRCTLREWKAGFYRIAHGAGLPVVRASMDYKAMRSGLGPLLRTSGDIEADGRIVKAFYAPFSGRHVGQFDAKN